MSDLRVVPSRTVGASRSDCGSCAAPRPILRAAMREGAREHPSELKYGTQRERASERRPLAPPFLRRGPSTVTGGYGRRREKLCGGGRSLVRSVGLCPSSADASSLPISSVEGTVEKGQSNVRFASTRGRSHTVGGTVSSCRPLPSGRYFDPAAASRPFALSTGKAVSEVRNLTNARPTSASLVPVTTPPAKPL